LVALRLTLLTIHILSAVVWFGAGLYDFFLTREIASAAGRPAEVALIRIHLRHGPVIATAMFLVFINGTDVRTIWLGVFFHIDVTGSETISHAGNTGYADRFVPLRTKSEDSFIAVNDTKSRCGLRHW
jgi:hypothetical protein